jgi:hypothetical protein
MSTNNNDGAKVVPVTSGCPTTPIDVVITTLPGSATSDTLNDLTQKTDQLNADTQYDTINQTTIKPLTSQAGGKKNKKYNINFINKNYIVYEKDELKAIKNIINNKKYKKEHILSINKSLYIIKNTKNNNNNIKKV